MNDERLILKGLSDREQKTLAAYGFQIKKSKRAANAKASERLREQGQVRMEVRVKAADRADLRKLVAVFRAARDAGEGLQVTRVPLPHGSSSAVLLSPAAGRLEPQEHPRAASVSDPAGTSAGRRTPSSTPHVMDGGNVAARQACFHLPSSSAELTEMISGIVCAEGPLPLDALKHRVATAHDWGRAGRQISARIMACSSEIELHDEAGVIFAWQKDGHFPRAVYRHVPGRVVREISRHELADLLDRNAAAVNAAADPVREFARLAGVGRLTRSATEYLESCLAWWRANPLCRET